MPSDGTSDSCSLNWNPAAARSYAKYTQSDATSDTDAPVSAVSRTSNGRCRAKNMMMMALTNGAQVMIESRCNPIIGFRGPKGSAPRETGSAPQRQRDPSSENQSPQQHEDNHAGAAAV